MKSVHRIELRASFYVIAETEREAEEAANVCFPLGNLEIELPASAEPRYSAYRTPNQSDDMKSRCVNLD